MSIIEVLVTSTLVSGLVAGLIGLWRDRNMEQFKNELRAEAFEHETRFASLHGRRADVVGELYRLMVVAQERIEAAAQPKLIVPTIVGEPEARDTLGDQAYQAYQEFETYRDLNRLYLTKDQTVMTDEIVTMMRSAALAARLKLTPRRDRGNSHPMSGALKLVQVADNSVARHGLREHGLVIRARLEPGRATRMKVAA